VAPAYSLDALVEENGESRVVHVMSLIGGGSGINGLTAVEGRLPQAADECAVDNGKQNQNINLGDVISLASGTEDDLSEKLAVTKYTVVGFVNAPNYLNRERGTSSIGNGKVTGLVYVPMENFTLDAYTELYATIAGSGDVSAFGADYDTFAQTQDDAMDALAREREAIRYEEVLSEANETLAEKQGELDDAEAEADQELADAQSKLDDAARSFQTRRIPWRMPDEADEKFADAEAAISKSEKKLTSGRADYKDNRAAYEDSVAAAGPRLPRPRRRSTRPTPRSRADGGARRPPARLAQNGTQVPLTDEQISVLEAQIADGEAEIDALNESSPGRGPISPR
jgi:putative ABC transport system permease protein